MRKNLVSVELYYFLGLQIEKVSIAYKHLIFLFVL